MKTFTHRSLLVAALLAVRSTRYLARRKPKFYRLRPATVRKLPSLLTNLPTTFPPTKLSQTADCWRCPARPFRPEAHRTL